MSDLSNNRKKLSEFLAGRLPDTENEEIIQELLSDDEALSAVDDLWQASAGSLLRPLPPDAEAAQQVEKQLFRRIRRSELTNQFITLGGIGFLDVLLAFIKPLLSSGDSKTEGD